MPPGSPPDDPKLSSDPMLHRVLADVASTGSEMEQRRSDALLAKERLFPLVEDGNGDRRLIAYLTGPGLGNIDLADAAPIGSMLDAIGTCDYLDLMLNSPGGSGETAEKIVEMCRDHCRKEFRVIVPNYAKSAGTLISLGADSVVMGYLSELGPIDPQILVAVSGVQHMVSGQSFIQAYETTQEKVKEALASGESAIGYLQSLNASTMEPAFIEHCRRGVEFSRDIAKKFLPAYQLKAKHKGEAGFGKKKLEELAVEVAENLLSRDARFSHGRLIGAEEARDEVGLNVDYLQRDDPLWEAYWELYLRAEVFMQTVPTAPEQGVSKLFFDRDSTLPALGPS
jgi:hypothetical protein